MSARILVVDDTPANVKLLVDLLRAKGYEAVAAASGEEALARIAAAPPDLVLLDIMMPGLSGYEVCRRIRADAATALLPVVLCTSLDPKQERLHGIEAGADDFIPKPINQQELFARVKSLLRIKSLQDEVKAWNGQLEQRVQEQLAQMQRLERLKNFFSPQLAEAIVSGGADDPLKSHRREITVVFLDLRGFTAFTETADPEEVMGVLREYHAAMGELILAHQGTLERFTGDGIMIFFNDPVPVPDPAARAARMALQMQQRTAVLAQGWKRRGYALQLGIGIATGYATIGAIGFEGRIDYGAIGNVTNLAARLCGEAQGGEILLAPRVSAALEGSGLALESAGEFQLKGFARPVAAARLIMRAADEPPANEKGHNDDR
ncbi:MAG TPA: response regulator [Rubrivivax sp.]|nr:response regulator [Rubrivivax sp.]